MIVILVIVIIVLIVIILILPQIEVWTQINFHKLWYPEYYRGLTFPIRSTDPNVLNQIEMGKAIAGKSSIVICGLARNIKNNFVKIRERLTYIGQQFQDYRIICFENDSTDGSRELLEQWMIDNSHFILLNCDKWGSHRCQLKTLPGYTLGFMSKKRMQNMAIYREEYLNYVKTYYSNFDYMLVCDFDLNGNQSMDGLYHSLAATNWTAIFINGHIPICGTYGLYTIMYDGLANIPLNDNTPMKNKTLTNIICQTHIMNTRISSHSSLYEVKSAFNGYGLYKISSLTNVSYIGKPQCEHINLADSIRQNGGHLYINPLWKGYFNIQGPGGPIDILLSYFTPHS